MKIDNHILSLSMEFEKNNILINEWETQKAKLKHDKKYQRVKRNHSRNKGKKKRRQRSRNGFRPEIQVTEHQNGDEEEANVADNEESGFEDDEDSAGRHGSAGSRPRSGSKSRADEGDEDEGGFAQAGNAVVNFI